MREYLEKAIRGVIEQGKPSVEPGTRACLYRGPDGLKCAAGHCIPDEVYDPSMEDINIAAVIAKTPQLHHLPQSQLGSIQNCHDQASTNEDRFVEVFKEQISLYVKHKALPEYCLEFLK